MKEKKLFRKDFTMVVIGQIISLFGNAILRFALPLYLLNQTHSPGLFGMVSACSFIPMILLSPIGGLLADRVNKRNIMVILDYGTALLITIYTMWMGKVDLVLLLLVTMVILYGIQGAYQPAVQASIPNLVDQSQLMPANAIINQVSSLSNLVGPVIGGAVFGFWGLRPILYISITCFLVSATMELFIKIPYHKEHVKGTVFTIAKSDLKDSFSFIYHSEPIIWKIACIVSAFNLFLSALIIIGLPVLITQTLSFSEQSGNRLYGYAQGIMAAGGLAGGILAGILGEKLKPEKSYCLLLYTALTLLPIGGVLYAKAPDTISYAVILICCFVMMLLATLFTIEMLAYIQRITPTKLIGKILSCVMCISMCAQPIGQALYGGLFQKFPDHTYVIIGGAAVITGIISLSSRAAFDKIKRT